MISRGNDDAGRRRCSGHMNEVPVTAGMPNPIRPIWLTEFSVNHRSPVGDWAIRNGKLPGVNPDMNSVTAPSVVIRPMRLPLDSVNQSAPSGPATIPLSSAPAVIPVLNSVIVPSVVMRPMRSPYCSVNQRFPSGPLVMIAGRLVPVGQPR